MILRLDILAQFGLVTDGQTHDDSIYLVSIAVKTTRQNFATFSVHVTCGGDYGLVMLDGSEQTARIIDDVLTSWRHTSDVR